jgi:hypothetical protein
MGAQTRLRVNTEKLGDIREIIRYLQVFEQAYNHLYAFEFIIQDAKRRHQELNKSDNSRRSTTKPVKTIASVRKPEEIVLPDDRIIIRSIVIESPGFWEFLGALNPLEVIRKYLCDRHERKKDKAYRDRQEEERGELENEKLRTEVVHKKVEILKELGVSEERIRRAVFEHVIKSLENPENSLREDGKKF